jgi:hypothetical protein
MLIMVVGVGVLKKGTFNPRAKQRSGRARKASARVELPLYSGNNRSNSLSCTRPKIRSRSPCRGGTRPRAPWLLADFLDYTSLVGGWTVGSHLRDELLRANRFDSLGNAPPGASRRNGSVIWHTYSPRICSKRWILKWTHHRTVSLRSSIGSLKKAFRERERDNGSAWIAANSSNCTGLRKSLHNGKHDFSGQSGSVS